MATNSLRPLKADQFDYWKAQHLLNRAGFGGTPSQIRALANMGLNDAVDYIVDYESVADSDPSLTEFDSSIMRPPSREEQQRLRQARQAGNESLVEQFRRERQRRQGRDRAQIREMQRWWLARLIESPRPLEEKLTLFWHGHFATGYRAIENSFDMYQQNLFLRRFATDRFSELVYGIVRDPAMLRYLNNNQNRRQAPNENLARELMELFTLGEGNLYTEQDIKEGARALTGYTYNYDTTGDPPRNVFVFQERQHDPGRKRILGETGTFNGIDFANIILRQRIVSEFITWKLYRFFVNDMPGDPQAHAQGFIKKLARLMRDRDYALKPVLRTLFKSEHFYDDANVVSLIKSPTQLIVQAVRSLRTPTRSLPALLNGSDLMGQSIFYPPTVKGWDGGRAWINTATMFIRQNMLIYLLTGRRPESYPWEADGSYFDATHLVDHLRDPNGALDTRDVVVYLLRFNLGTEPSPERVETLVDFVRSHGGRIDNDMLVGLLSLITAMPEYQLC